MVQERINLFKEFLEKSRGGSIFLLITGVIVLSLVSIQSFRQIVNYKTTVAITGFEVEANTRHYVSGYLKTDNIAGLDNEYLETNSKNKIQYSESEIPYIGKVYSNEQNEVSFIVSGNVYSEKNKEQKYLNVILPKCYLSTGKGKSVFNTLIEPNTRISEESLLKNKLFFVDRVSGITIFKLWLEDNNGKKIVKSTSFAKSGLNFSNRKVDFIKVIHSNDYTLSVTDPHYIFVLPAEGNEDATATFEINKTGFGKYELKRENRSEIVEINNKSNTFYWKNWEFSVLGIPSYIFISGSFIVLISCWIFFIWLISRINKSKYNLTHQVEIRLLHLLAVYVIFTALSLLFINHLWLSNLYERSFGLLFASIPFGFLIAYFWIKYKDKKHFHEKNTNPRHFFDLENKEGIYVKKRLMLPAFLIITIDILIFFLTSNERLVIGDLGIPVLHISKILVCVLIYVFRDRLFEGDPIAHAFLWTGMTGMTILTGDVSSLLFTIISYTFICKIYIGKVNLPNFFKIDAWKKSITTSNNFIPEENLLNHFHKILLVVVFIVFVVGVTYGYIPILESKIDRFALTYTNLNPDDLLALSNGHKESYAKLYWVLNDVFSGNNIGNELNFRAVNFFTTWHTDLAFLSFLQFGGIVSLVIVSVLLIFLLFDYFISFAFLQTLFKNIKKFEIEDQPLIHKFLLNNIYVMFLLAYLLIQTIYPVLCNLTLVPLTGQPIPGLSVSITEYILTPFLLAFIYGVIGGVVHNNLIMENDMYTRNGHDNEERDPDSNMKFYGWFLNKKVEKSLKYLSIFVLIVVGLTFLKIKFWNNPNVNNEEMTFQYIANENEKLNTLIDSINGKPLRSSIPNKQEMDKNLLFEANKMINNDLGKKDAKVIISAMKEYMYADAYNGKKSTTSFISYNDSLGINSKINCERIIKNSIRKETVIKNMSFTNYYDEEKHYFRTEDPNIKNESSIYSYNNKVYIHSDFLSPDFAGNDYFFGGSTTRVGKRYDGMENYYVSKIINGKPVSVMKYPALGNINLYSTTYDMDLQAILNTYLRNYAQTINGSRIGSIVIAENKTGKIRIMASYPSYANRFGDRIKHDIKRFKGLKIISNLDVKGLQNYALADAMPGSTFKPVYTFAALANDSTLVNNHQVFSISLPEFITTSNPEIAKKLFRDQYNKDGFGDQMFRCFDIRVFAEKNYGKRKLDYLASNTYIIDKNQIKNGELSTKANWSSAWGQGNVQMSLATLVRDFIRINERKAVKLTFNEQTKEFEDLGITPSSVQPLYDGMNGTIFRGTASQTGLILQRLFNNNIENANLYRGKTGTVQFAIEHRTKLNNSGVSVNEFDNSNTYLILTTPSYTIGVSLSGILPHSQNDSHAKGVMNNMLGLLKNWRNGMYLK